MGNDTVESTGSEGQVTDTERLARINASAAQVQFHLRALMLEVKAMQDPVMQVRAMRVWMGIGKALEDDPEFQ